MIFSSNSQLGFFIILLLIWSLHFWLVFLI